MNISQRWSELIAIEFTLGVGDVLKLLRDAGHVPEGFAVDCHNPEATDWPIKLHLRKEIEKPQPVERDASRE